MGGGRKEGREGVKEGGGQEGCQVVSEVGFEGGKEEKGGEEGQEEGRGVRRRGDGTGWERCAELSCTFSPSYSGSRVAFFCLPFPRFLVVCP